MAGAGADHVHRPPEDDVDCARGRGGGGPWHGAGLREALRPCHPQDGEDAPGSAGRPILQREHVRRPRACRAGQGRQPVQRLCDGRHPRCDHGRAALGLLVGRGRHARGQPPLPRQARLLPLRLRYVQRDGPRAGRRGQGVHQQPLCPQPGGNTRQRVLPAPGRLRRGRQALRNARPPLRAGRRRRAHPERGLPLPLLRHGRGRQAPRAHAGGGGDQGQAGRGPLRVRARAQ
mmetsp:Transcript_11608/g.31302  ORF Transcript_11608/g.31302 Transcript_11608/m.31302 type:complete len:232 (+) Transcript_11608:180-875(+)